MEAGKESTRQAYELTLDMFGVLEEVREMAAMMRKVRSYDEARSSLRELTNRHLTSKSGLEATISNKSVDKILSGKAIGKSASKEAHFLAVANLERLFSNAIEPFEFPFDPEKSNENYLEIKRLYAPMAFVKRIIPVKFTVMVMRNEREGKRIYSLEAINVDLDKK